MRGQLTQRADQRQAEVEDPLYRLGAELVRLEQAELRVRQAIERRPEMRDLLTPVLEHIQHLKASIRGVQRPLREIFDREQANSWKTG